MIETKRNITNNIGYCGTVTAELVDKKGKVHNTTVLHNSGRWPLYSYFCKTVAGEVDDSLRPRYIQLYTAGSAGADKPTINNDNPLNETRFGSGALTREVITNKIYSGDINKNETSTSSITIKFLIPVAEISNPSQNAINLLVLKSAYGLGNIEYSSAYTFVVDDNDPTKIGSLLDMSIIGQHQNEYNLSITWKITFANNIQ